MSVNLTENALSCLVQCSTDNTFLLSTEPNSNFYWFVCERSSEEDWRSHLQQMVKEHFQIAVTQYDLLKLYKFWLPEAHSLFHAVFIVPLNADQKKKIKFNSKSKRKFKWFTVQEITILITQGGVKSLEVADCVSKVTGKILPTAKNTFYEIHQLADGPWNDVLGTIPLHTMTEVLEKHVVVRTEGSNLNPYEQLLAAAAFNKKEQCFIYLYFLSCCFPCMYMNVEIFNTVCSSLGWIKNEEANLFRTADVHSTSTISFRDFLYIFAACEPAIQHGGPAAEIRCRYIFRYYNKANDRLLHFSEFKAMMADIRKEWGMASDIAACTKEAETIVRNLGLEPHSDLNISDFLQSAGQLNLRGTSVLLRSKKGLLSIIDETSFKITTEFAPVSTPHSSKSSYNANSTRMSDFELALHCVKFKHDSPDLDVDEMWYYEKNGQVEKPTKLTKKVKESPAKEQFSRMLSVDSFNKKSIANEFLALLRSCVKANLETDSSKDGNSQCWTQVDPNEYGKKLISLCEKVREMCRKEPRLLEIESPVYVIGDLHGNLFDLTHFEKALWSLGPTLTPSTLLFLGDYVDRGIYGVEVVTYLFSYKLQNPQKTRLLRGNHEVRTVQKTHTFHKECIKKFGNDLGQEVWEAVNKVFDCLPVAAVIDSKIFCCHGGIPPPWLCPQISAINSIPVPLLSPDQQSALAWDLMWNDPLKQKKLTEQTALELLTNDGFATNIPRGTAHIFNMDALDHFLMVNNFSHVIRAHEVQRTGFLVQQKGKLITVFSSSGYGGGTNEAACVLAEGRKLRIFRLHPKSAS